jgi:hypothetical protein
MGKTNMPVLLLQVELNVLVDNDTEGRAVGYNLAAGSGFNAITVEGRTFMGGVVKQMKPRSAMSRCVWAHPLCSIKTTSDPKQ